MHDNRPKKSASNVSNVVGALASVLSDAIQHATQSSGLEASATAALVHLSKYPSQTVDQLRGPLALTHSGCVRMVDRLETAQLLERHPSLTDRRAVTLKLTRKGRALVERLNHARLQAVAEGLQSLTQAELQCLGQLASKALEKATADGASPLRTCRLCDYQACTDCPVRAGYLQRENPDVEQSP